MGRDEKSRSDDDYDVDDTVDRQMSTSGMTDVMEKLRQNAGDKPAEPEQAEDDES